MRVLVLGGTWFLGRAVVQEALLRGQDITTFNRGKSGRDAPGVEAIRGDRQVRTDIERLVDDRSWDAVIDTSGYVPSTVWELARALADRVEHYVFVSTVSVYTGWPVKPLSEESPVLDCPPNAGADYGEDDPRGYPTQYGIQKAGCERAVYESYGRRALVVRPGVILGPYEYVGRLAWWLRRVQGGGRVLAPGDPGKAIQPIDSRDVAGFVLDCLKTGVAGTFNLTAPKGHATFGSLLSACIEVTASDAELIWVDDDFLMRNGLRQWTEIPLWRTYAGTWSVSSDRAQKAGLVCRPISETVRDTWAWLTGEGKAVVHDRQSEHGILAEKEQRLLEAWEACLR